MQLINSSNPILHRTSKLVDETLLEDNAKGIQPVISLLIQKITEHNALGISACQIGIDMAVFVTQVDNITKVCINPQIVAASAEMSKEDEGCLSYPGLWLKVNRPNSVVVRYINETGKEVTEQLDDLHARVWLHEYDHTQGICFVDRVSKLTKDIAIRKQLKRARKQ